jgi:hypothetical protein
LKFVRDLSDETHDASRRGGGGGAVARVWCSCEDERTRS